MLLNWTESPSWCINLRHYAPVHHINLHTDVRVKLFPASTLNISNKCVFVQIHPIWMWIYVTQSWTWLCCNFSLLVSRNTRSCFMLDELKSACSIDASTQASVLNSVQITQFPSESFQISFWKPQFEEDWMFSNWALGETLLSKDSVEQRWRAAWRRRCSR